MSINMSLARGKDESYEDYAARRSVENLSFSTRHPKVLWSNYVETPNGRKGVSYVKKIHGELGDKNANNKSENINTAEEQEQAVA